MEDYIIDALRGDHAAFSRLHDDYAPAALRLSAAITGSVTLAEDAVQEAFLRVFRKGYQCRKAGSFAPWFFRIVTNESKRALEKNPKSRELSEAGREPAAPPFTEKSDISLTVGAVLENLSAEHRGVLMFKFMFGYSEAEIGKILRTPVGTVKSRIHYAKKAMLREMDRKGVGDEEDGYHE